MSIASYNPDADPLNPAHQYMKALQDRAEAAEQDARALRADLATAERLLKDGAAYLDALESNMLRNDVDMLLDKCESPESIAETFRAFLTRKDTPNAR